MEFTRNATATYLEIPWPSQEALGGKPKERTLRVRATPKFFSTSTCRVWDRDGKHIEQHKYKPKILMKVVGDDGSVLFERQEAPK